MLFRGLGDTGREGIGLWRVTGGVGPGYMGRVGLSIRDWENRKALEISEVAEMVLESDQVACNRVRM